MEITEILSRFDGVKATGSNQWMARCPCHDDQKQSLSIGVGQDGKILFHDLAGCDTLKILDAVGLKQQDLFPPKENDNWTLEATYTYPNGKTRKRKWRHPDGGKSFDWQHLSKSGDWVRGRGGPARLYYHPDDIKAQEACEHGMVFLLEGERDCDTAHMLNLPAVSTPDGATVKNPWKDSYAAAFKDKYVFIIPDNDQPGRDFAQKMAEHISPIAYSLKVLDLKIAWPEVPTKGDFTDFANAVGLETAWDKIVNVIDTTPEWTPKAPLEINEDSKAEDVQEIKHISARELMALDIPDPQFIVEDLLPDVGLTLLSAPSKYGKSWLCLQLCLSVSLGMPFLDHETMQCETLYLALEDGPRSFKPRLRKQLNALGIDEVPEAFHIAFEAPGMDDAGLQSIEKALQKTPGIKLVVIDVLALFRSYKGAQSLDAYQRDYRVLRQLKSFADGHGISLLCVTHNAKTKNENDRFEQISGSVAQMATSDCTWILFRENRDDIDTAFNVTGRCTRGGNFTLRFDDQDCIWKYCGEEMDLRERLERSAYERSALIKTIKLLLQDPPHRWSGRSRDLMRAGQERLGQTIALSSQDAAKQIGRFKADLLRFDGIACKTDSAKRRVFYYQDLEKQNEVDADSVPDNVVSMFDDVDLDDDD